MTGSEAVASTVRPIRTQHLIFFEGEHRIMPVDGYTTGSPWFVITPSVNVMRDDHWELTHTPTGYAIGGPWPGDRCTLNDLAALAQTLAAWGDWGQVRRATDFADKVADVVRAELRRFWNTHGLDD